MTEGLPDFARPVDSGAASPIRFSICTLVTHPNQYAEMATSFVAGGFVPEDCEYLYVDNRASNQLDAFAAYNRFLTTARGEFVILCHQDVCLLDDGRNVLEQRLAELSEVDPDWAACGNAGGTAPRMLAIRITDRYGPDQRSGSFPARVSALDENFIVVRRDANLAVSHDLRGFHLYGADLCIIAEILGRTCYAIDFHLEHKGEGAMGPGYYAVRSALLAKYEKALRARWITSTTTHFKLSANPIRSWIRKAKQRVQGD